MMNCGKTLYRVLRWHMAVAGTVVCAASAQELAGQESQEPLVTDRPDFTESAETIPRGRVQIESGATWERSGDERTSSFGEALIRIGTGGRSELRIGVPSYLRVKEAGARDSGFDDLYLGGKWVLKKGDGRKPQVALLAGSTLPTGSRRVAERRAQPEAVIAAALDVNERVGFSTNLGYAYASDGGTRFNQLFGSAAVGYGLSEKWATYLEVFAFHKTEAGGNSQKFVNAGVTYLINNDFQLDARYGRGLNSGVGREHLYGIGASRRF